MNTTEEKRLEGKIKAKGLIDEDRIGEQLGLVAPGMMEAQIVGGLSDKASSAGLPARLKI